MLGSETELEEFVRAQGVSDSADSEDLRALRELERKEGENVEMGGTLSMSETRERGWKLTPSRYEGF